MATNKQPKKIAGPAPDDDFSGLIQGLTHVHEHLVLKIGSGGNFWYAVPKIEIHS
jgi:hypothetical protein